MDSQKFNFLPKRSIFSRQRMYFVGGFLFLAVVAAAGGLYFRERHLGSVAVAEVKGAVDSRILPKEWLMKYFLTDDMDAVAVNGPDGDPDGDTLSNYQEYLFGTDPTKDDTDGDGYIDGYELAFNLDPLGPGSLSADVENSYVKEFLVSNEQYQDLAQDKILGQFEQLLQPDRAVVMDFPDDRELTITSDNSTEAFEKYHERRSSRTRGYHEQSFCFFRRAARAIYSKVAGQRNSAESGAGSQRTCEHSESENCWRARGSENF